jgi:lipoprotein-anchoring transpeptidase ErfK/SrfK
MRLSLRKLCLLMAIALLLALLFASSSFFGFASPAEAGSLVPSTTLHLQSGQAGRGAVNSAAGKLIVVSLSHQWLYAYQAGQEIFNAAVMTGRPSLPTPTGTYHVFAKLSPTTFYSPWPPGSPYWYAPTHITYALEWRAGGFFLHDSWWHTVYGPGSNGWHYDPTYGWQWGSHGCVAMPLSAAAWLYHWAPIGTTVRVNP